MSPAVNPTLMAQMTQMHAMKFAMAGSNPCVPEEQEETQEPTTAAPEAEERFFGIIRDYSESQGFGFIECDEAKLRFGMDTFIHRRQMFGLSRGDEVSFIIIKNGQGQPQARNVIKKDDTKRILSKRKHREDR